MDEARNFLKDIRAHISNDDFLLIGFDLRKDISIIEYAYNDNNGVTSNFNLNLLNRINRELGANFNLDNFSHKAFFNRNKNRIEMHIESKKNQKVVISALKKEIEFKKDETIHTENSYKFEKDDINFLINRAGFYVEKKFSDANSWYELVLLKPQ
jgi:uncharacterized SAM-dependent methyltransferase